MRRFAEVIRDRVLRTWDITIDPPALDRVRDKLGFDLAEMIRTEPGDTAAQNLALLFADEDRLLALLFVLVEDQARSVAIGEPRFRQIVTGETLEAATKALVGSLCDHFEDQRRIIAGADARARRWIDNRPAREQGPTSLFQKLGPNG